MDAPKGRIEGYFRRNFRKGNRKGYEVYKAMCALGGKELGRHIGKLADDIGNWREKTTLKYEPSAPEDEG